MTDLELRPRGTDRRREGAVDRAVLEAALRDRVDGEVRFDAGSRAAYSTDASNYRQVPLGVVVPRTVEAGATAVAVCRDHGAPVLSRGGGTSLGGQCTNTAVVIDWTKHCHRLVSVDQRARTCVVEPGIVLDDLNARLAEHGLMFGPKPATHDHCTLGGMIGNNSCGSTAQAYGKTGDNVRRLEVLTYGGLRCWVGATAEPELEAITHSAGARAQLYRGLRDLRDRYGDLVRERFPDIPRRVSGYNLDALLPEQGFDVAKLLVGSEGTLVTVLHAELDLVPTVAHTAMLVLGFPDLIAAAATVPDILHRSPVTPLLVEAMDEETTGLMRRQGAHTASLDELPEGSAWLLVRFGGDRRDEAEERATRLRDALGKGADDADVALTADPAREKKIMQAREAALAVTAHPGPDRWPGWEDSAVAPERLAAYLRDLTALFAEFDLGRPAYYGHFGQGCVHVRIPFRFATAAGVADFRRFLERAADLVVSYGGSLSGEHGDGQARGELLERMFGPELVRGFAELKALFDPHDRMNPGKIVAPYRVDENLRLGPAWRPTAHRTWFGYPDDGGSFTTAVIRCVGVGQCRRTSPSGGVMCPSYQVTREEEHSTRGRARLLFEMLEGHADAPVRDGFRSTAVRDALDLCLACPDAVVLWPDTFTNHFDPHIARAAVEVLESAGFRVAVPREPVCCGLTWISTGQLGVARRRLQTAVAGLHPWIAAGTPVVGLEPSCTAVFRSDAPELMPDDRDVARLAGRFVTLAEALQHHAPRPWHPRRLERAAIVQVHCHQHAVLGVDADREVLRRAGIDVHEIDSGCCGLAGNFGFEAGHYAVSMACAEQALLPAVRAADPTTLVLADGFSCRTQIAQAATGRRAIHVAEALLGAAGRVPGVPRRPGRSDDGVEET